MTKLIIASLKLCVSASKLLLAEIYIYIFFNLKNSICRPLDSYRLGQPHHWPPLRPPPTSQLLPYLIRHTARNYFPEVSNLDSFYIVTSTRVPQSGCCFFRGTSDFIDNKGILLNYLSNQESKLSTNDDIMSRQSAQNTITSRALKIGNTSVSAFE
jgi:hypothetical protein